MQHEQIKIKLSRVNAVFSHQENDTCLLCGQTLNMLTTGGKFKCSNAQLVKFYFRIFSISQAVSLFFFTDC